MPVIKQNLFKPPQNDKQFLIAFFLKFFLFKNKIERNNHGNIFFL